MSDLSERINTVQAVEWRLVKLREVQDDTEVAHSIEKATWEAVLHAIADDDTADPQALAQAALRTIDVDFPRWFA